jgi:hypothetical protein
MCQLVGSQDASAQAPPAAVAEVRRIISEHVGYRGGKRTSPPHCHTRIHAELLEAWRSSAQDPDYAVCEWLVNGSPAGITQSPEACGIFPSTEDSAECSIEELFTEYDSFCNYSGVEANDVAEQTVTKYLDKGYLMAFDTVEELANFVGHPKPS